jgi:hypothetical protein
LFHTLPALDREKRECTCSPEKNARLEIRMTVRITHRRPEKEKRRFRFLFPGDYSSTILYVPFGEFPPDSPYSWIPCFSPTSLVPDFLLDLRHSLLLPDLPRSGISPWLASFLLLPDLPHSGISPWLASFLLLPDLPHSGISPWLTSFPDSHRIPLLTKGNHGKSRESFLQTGSLLSHNFMRSSA